MDSRGQENNPTSFSSNAHQPLSLLSFQPQNLKIGEEIKLSDMERLMKKFEEQERKLDSCVLSKKDTFEDHARRLTLQKTTLKNLEVQIGQIAQETQFLVTQ